MNKHKDIASIIFLVGVVVAFFVYFKLTAVNNITNITNIFLNLREGMFELKYKEDAETKTIYGTFTNNNGELTFTGLDEELNPISIRKDNLTKLNYIYPKCMLGDTKSYVSLKRIVQGKDYYCITNAERTAYLNIEDDMFGYKVNIEDETDNLVKNTYCNITLDNSGTTVVEMEMKFIVGLPDTASDETNDYVIFITNNYW